MISTADNSNLVKQTDYKTKINEIQNKINGHDHALYITTQEFNKLTADNFAARLAQANLASKDDITKFLKKTNFDDKLKEVNRKFTLNKTKQVLVENELNKLSEKVKILSTKDYIFLLGRIYFKSDGGFQIMFVY